MNSRRSSSRRTPSTPISQFDRLAQCIAKRGGFSFRKASAKLQEWLSKAAKCRGVQLEDMRRQLDSLMEDEPRLKEVVDEVAHEKRKNRLSDDKLAVLKELQAFNERIKKGQFSLVPGQPDDLPLLSDLSASIVRLTLEGSPYRPAKEVARRLGISRQKVNREIRFLLDHMVAVAQQLRDCQWDLRQLDPVGLTVEEIRLLRPEQNIWHIRATEKASTTGQDRSTLLMKSLTRWVEFGLPRCHNPRCRAILIPEDFDFNGIRITKARRYCSPACRKDRQLRHPIRSLGSELHPPGTADQFPDEGHADRKDMVQQGEDISAMIERAIDELPRSLHPQDRKDISQEVWLRVLQENISSANLDQLVKRCSKDVLNQYHNHYKYRDRDLAQNPWHPSHHTPDRPKT